jgi:hypothetical protein
MGLVSCLAKFVLIFRNKDKLANAALGHVDASGKERTKHTHEMYGKSVHYLVLNLTVLTTTTGLYNRG